MKAAVKHTAKIIAGIVPNGDYETWPVWMVYLPHVTALANHEAESVDASLIYDHLSQYLLRIGWYNEAEKRARIARGLRTKLLGYEHPDTLTTVSNLATIYILLRGAVRHLRRLEHFKPDIGRTAWMSHDEE